MELGVIRDLQGQATAKSGASKQSSSFLKATTMTLFTISESEKSSYLSRGSPISEAVSSYISSYTRFIQSCERWSAVMLINIVVLGGIDERAVNIRTHGIGWTVVNIRTQDLVEGRSKGVYFVCSFCSLKHGKVWKLKLDDFHQKQIKHHLSTLKQFGPILVLFFSSSSKIHLVPRSRNKLGGNICILLHGIGGHTYVIYKAKLLQNQGLLSRVHLSSRPQLCSFTNTVIIHRVFEASWKVFKMNRLLNLLKKGSVL
ncbi:hypothetical protein SADUNF_Sadunf04G0099900 [Salix dunnii]|uniref:Uncharacterized protein n=1 Tax=Salix dunnii TaxID=1413687 RepID=A0A835KB25_9ROSI|nr:hypothetical protein SADUNF_Sadunf04G0099900 [Salix dunnii]